MQGFERMDREFTDAEMLAGHLVPAGSMFAFLAAHRAEVFPDADYADLFAAFGRPSLPATRMAAVLALQSLHDYSDREAAEAVRFDVRWKVACGLAIDDAGFDPSSLVYWRGRIAKSERPHRVNEAIRLIVEQTGVLAGRRRRAVDSTILADAVATQDTITQLVSAIRRVAREVPGAGEQIAAVCTGHDYSKPGKPKIDWDDPAAKDALVCALVSDANALVEAFGDAELDVAAASAVALVALVAGQDVEPAEGSDGTDGRWRIARKVAGDRVISTVDPDARHTRKSPEARRDGYRAHLAADPETGIITDEKLTWASGTENSDPAVAEEFLAAGAGQGEAGPAAAEQPPATGEDGDDDSGAGQHGEDGTGREPLAWYGDSAYGTGDLRGAIGDAGHGAVIKPKPLQAPVAGGFTVDDFTVDEQAGPRRARPGTLSPSAGSGSPPSAWPAATARCGTGAPPARPAASSSCTNAMTCCGPPARTGPPIPGCARTTWRTGRTWNAPSPRWRPAGAGGSSSATAGWPRTTPGSNAAPPRSTCATCSARA